MAGKMKIVRINKVGKKSVYDVSVADVEHYILKNGVVTHNTGPYYSADTIWILGRQQDKDDKTKDINGYDFIINVEKSRYVKEKSKIPISISFESGINRWSGLLDIALEGEYIAKPSPGWYSIVNKETGEVFEEKYRYDDIVSNNKFWTQMLKETDLATYIENKYKMASSKIIEKEE